MAVQAQTVRSFKSDVVFSTNPPTKQQVIDLAQKATKVAGGELDKDVATYQLLHVHHVNGDRLEAMRTFAKNHKDNSGPIFEAVWKHLSNDGQIQTEWRYGEKMLVQEGAIDAEAAKAITELALNKMIPDHFKAYNTAAPAATSGVAPDTGAHEGDDGIFGIDTETVMKIGGAFAVAVLAVAAFNNPSFFLPVASNLTT